MNFSGLLDAGLTQFVVLLAVIGARPLGFVMLHPIFSYFGINSGVLRGAVIVAMCAPVLPGAMAMAMADPAVVSPAGIPLMVLRELLIGLVLGVLTGIPFWAAIAAGAFIDMQRGASMATLVDPSSGGENTVLGTTFFLICILVLAAEGVLFPSIFGPLMESYRLVPVMGDMVMPDPQQGKLALSLLDQITRAGLILSMPILIPLLLTEILLAVALKYTTQINAMFTGMSVKQAVTFVLLLIYAVIFARYAMSDIGKGPFGVEALSPFLRGVVE